MIKLSNLVSSGRSQCVTLLPPVTTAREESNIRCPKIQLNRKAFRAKLGAAAGFWSKLSSVVSLRCPGETRKMSAQGLKHGCGMGKFREMCPGLGAVSL